MRIGMVWAAALAVSSCGYDLGSNDPASVTLEGAGLDETALLGLAADRDYAAHGFELVTPEDVRSTALVDSTIRVWVSGPDAAQYRDWQGEAFLNVAEGTVVVREVYGGDGGLASVTMLAKGPKGYNPEVSDLWFAKTDANGDVVEDAHGTPLVGRVASCGGCHTMKVPVGGLFGIPRDR